MFVGGLKTCRLSRSEYQAKGQDGVFKFRQIPTSTVLIGGCVYYVRNVTSSSLVEGFMETCVVRHRLLLSE